MKNKTIYWAIVGGSGLGLAASFLQMLEKITLLKNPTAPLSCNLNSVFSCTNVLNAWQSSVFGFPNSLMCIVFFSLVLGIGLAGLTGSKLNKKLRFTMQGLALFFLAFGTWFLLESTYVIKSLCIFCIFCYAGLLFINGAWLRLNYNDIPISQSKKETIQSAVIKGTDTFVWLLIALALGFVMIIQFA